MPESTKPIRHVRRGMIQAAVWKNQSDGGTVFYTTTFERLYLDEQGAWKHTQGFSRDDLLLLGRVAELALDEIFELQETDRASQKSRNGGQGSPTPQAASSAASRASKPDGQVPPTRAPAGPPPHREARTKFAGLPAFAC
ncbi:MAG: hypothetical protein U0638_05390 [Phycisphaerales bacterium]